MKKMQFTIIVLFCSLSVLAQNKIESTGDVGIGTISPDDALEVVGGITVSGLSRGTSTSSWGSLSGKPVYTLISSRLDGIDNSLHGFGVIQTTHFESPYLYGYNSIGNMMVFGSVSAGDRNPATGLTPRLVIDMYNGNVGIGTNTPNSKLHIQNGTTAFNWTPIVGTVGIFESSVSNRAFVTILGKSNGQSELWFGDNSRQNSGRIRYEHDTDGLEFWTNGTNKMTLTNNGYIGIGTDDPKSNLDIRTSGKSGVMSTLLSNQGITDGDEVHRWTIRTGRSYDYPNRTLDFGMVSDGYGSNPAFYVAPKGIEVFRITESGNVGIGTEEPLSKLAVNGQIRATEIKVLANINVPDYVFEEDYDLRTLKETKEYIAKNKHLPEIPSATEIGENGLNLGEMNMRLLKKIEELTLYQIQLMERIEKLEKER